MQRALLDSARTLFRLSKDNANDELLRSSGVLGDILDMLGVHLLCSSSANDTTQQTELDAEGGEDAGSSTSFALAPTHVGLLDELILTSAVLKNASFNESNQRFLGQRTLLKTLARYVQCGELLRRMYT